MAQRYARIEGGIVIEIIDLDDEANVDDYFPESLGFQSCPANIEPNWQFDGSSYSEPLPISLTGDQASEVVRSVATRARSTIAGTSDPAKFAEYADKASFGQAVIDGTAPAEIVSEAEAEAPTFGAANAAEMAQIWLDRAAALRIARVAVNGAERQALADIDSGSDPIVVANDFRTQVEAMLSPA